MSASREKQTRQEQASSGWIDPKTVREAQQRKQERRSNILYGVIAVVFVIAAVVTIVWRSNLIPKLSTAVTIDGEKYTAAEVNFYYQNVYSGFYNQYYYYMMLGYISLNTSASLDSQELTDEDAAMLGIEPVEGQTWQDYFIDQTLNQMAAVQSVLKDAEAEGFVYPDSVQTQYDSSMASLASSAAASGMTANQYLQAYLGSGMTEKIYGEQLLRTLKYTAYANAYEESLTYTDAELEEAYSADRTTYDKASYEYVSISGAAASTTDEEGNTVDPTEEESAAALEAAETAANEMLAAYQAGGDLETLAEANDSATYTSLDSGTYASSTLLDWVFDDAREEGDSAVLTSGTTYYVAVFHERYRDEYNTVAVRHILLTIDDSDLDSESETYEADLQARKDEVKAEAEALLAEWQSGEATEDSFAALANEKSQDSGSNTNGGLYSRFAKGTMVEEFNDWSFDPARKPGDTGIVYGEVSGSYMGYHIMYFVGTDIPYWQAQVTDTLNDAALDEWYDAYTQDHTIVKGSGLKYMG